MEVLRIDCGFYICLTGKGIIEVLSINYGLYTYIVDRVVTNLIVFCFSRKALGGFRTDFRTLGSPRIGRS